MFKKIVWATDGSDSADKALALAKVLVNDVGRELARVMTRCRNACEMGLQGVASFPRDRAVGNWVG